MTDWGNSVQGRQIGPNRVTFRDGTFIEYEYPMAKVSGLLRGKKTMHWVGEMEFTDGANGLIATLAFMKKRKGGYDQVEGAIRQNNRELAKIDGSFLEYLEFDEVLYWTLDETSMFRPYFHEKCLPSDCRFREDSIAFDSGDLNFAQKEKERLEEKQRADRRGREAAEKRRKKVKK